MFFSVFGEMTAVNGCVHGLFFVFFTLAQQYIKIRDTKRAGIFLLCILEFAREQHTVSSWEENKEK